MNHLSSYVDDIARLTALAERCAAEGQMNLNKLLEAALYAVTRRDAWQYRPQVTVTSMLPELEATLQFLAQRDGLSPELLAALEHGRQALVEHRPGDLLVEEAPDVFVCRTCGHTALGSPPKACPDCGSWAGRFRKFVAMFNGDNFEPTNPVEVLALLARNAASLQNLVERLSEEETSPAPTPGEWSIHDHVSHFYDTQEMLDTRIGLMLIYDDPELTALAVYELAKEADRHPVTTQDTLAEFRRKRSQCLARLESLPLKDLWRTSRHPEFGQITILRQAAYLAYHEQTHLPEIMKLCEQALRKR